MASLNPLTQHHKTVICCLEGAESWVFFSPVLLPLQFWLFGDTNIGVKSL